MIKGGVLRLGRNIVRGYLRVLKSLSVFILTLLAVGGITAIIVTPLWFLATRHSELYTIIAGCGLAAGLLAPFIIRLIKDSTRRKFFIARLARGLIFAVLAVMLYFTVLLYAWSIYAAAVPLSVIFVLATGLIVYAKSTAKG